MELVTVVVSYTYIHTYIHKHFTNFLCPTNLFQTTTDKVYFNVIEYNIYPTKNKNKTLIVNM